MYTLRLEFPPALVRSGRVVLLLMLGSAGLLVAADALAIDGNYSSPYASQWDARSSVATIGDATLLGMILLIVNTVITSFYVLRHRIRARKKVT